MLFIQIGIVFCMLSVIIGAFGAHSLSDIISDKTETFRTGVQYQIFHGLALILAGILSKVFEVDLSIVGYLFIVGIFLFIASRVLNTGSTENDEFLKLALVGLVSLLIIQTFQFMKILLHH